MTRSRRGFTMIEILIVIVMIGLLTAVMAPRLRISNRTRVRMAAQLLANDVEMARTRALTTSSSARMVFDAAAGSYTGYLDDDRNGAIAQTAAETQALGGFGTRLFSDGVAYGRGAALVDVPNLPGMGTITLPGGRVEFDSQGIVSPFGSKGVIYLTSTLDANAAAAVAITAAASVRVWYFNGGAWQ